MLNHFSLDGKETDLPSASFSLILVLKKRNSHLLSHLVLSTQDKNAEEEAGLVSNGRHSLLQFLQSYITLDLLRALPHPPYIHPDTSLISTHPSDLELETAMTPSFTDHVHPNLAWVDVALWTAFRSCYVWNLKQSHGFSRYYVVIIKHQHHCNECWRMNKIIVVVLFWRNRKL